MPWWPPFFPRTECRCLEQSLALAHAVGDSFAEALSLHTLSEVHREQGDLDIATGRLERSLAMFRDLGFRPWEAAALDRLGLILAAKADWPAACSAWRAALVIFRELGMPEAADVAARLAEPPAPATWCASPRPPSVSRRRGRGIG